MKLILIRHGLTDYNLKNRYCGFTDIGLSKTGMAQANKLKSKLRDLKVDTVYCSDLKRSWQSAKIIFGHNGCPIIKNPRLREINFGEWEGLNFKQIHKRYPSLFSKWIKNPYSVNIPSGEKINHFINRIRKEFKKIRSKTCNKNIVLVIHSGPIRVILNTILGIERKDYWRLHLKPQTIFILEYNNSLKPKIFKL